ncbi:MAG: glycosyltransferase family 1 protein [Eubacterium sp.]|nr:glycosyltransferase family 1 protein [Eubacterium sp.]
MNYYRQIDRTKIQFDFLVHRFNREAYDDEIERLGGKIHRLPKLNPFSNHYKETLGRFFDDHPEYSIIHVHQDCLSSVICKVAKKHNVKVRIAHSHSSSQNKNIKYFIKLYYKRRIPRYATDLMACSDEAGMWMFGGKDFLVLNNAIDARKYTYNQTLKEKMREAFDIGDDELLLGHVGRFSPPKNHAFLIDIFYEVQKRRKSKLILVGDGKLREGIVRKVRELGIEKQVIFTGLRGDVADLMQSMDMFVFPSVYEGLPLTIIEAQASGLPCFISDKVPIECKKTNLVQQIKLSEGAEKWAEIIVSYNDQNRRDTYDEICISGFDVKHNVKWLEEYYENCMSRNGER